MIDIIPDDKTCGDQAQRFDKFTRFLELPPEIRQKIYAHNLCFEREISVYLYPRGFTTKPPTPGLLRTNKQVYRETVNVLYSQNIFKFMKPDRLSVFANQIGPQNCKQVRDIAICVAFPTEEKIRLKEEYWPPLFYDDFLSPWIAALGACRLPRVVHLRIDAHIVCPYGDDMLFMPEDLQWAIEKFFHERRMAGKNTVPCLSLRGFRMGERKKFSEGWKVVMKEWDFYRHVKRKVGLKDPEEYFVDSVEEEDVDDGQ